VWLRNPSVAKEVLGTSVEVAFLTEAAPGTLA